MLAKRKRKRKSIGSALKYEVYGILIITLSVIALSGQGWPVDQALSNLFGLFLGDFYFVVPLVGIYVGLMTMIKRKWPGEWSTRKSGLLLLLRHARQDQAGVIAALCREELDKKPGRDQEV